MVAAMSGWGPDGQGQWCGEGVGLGNLMLHVTPESLYERMPASIRIAPHLVITADARIDNRAEIFDALGTPAAGRTKTPDSSLILLAYERWGAECVKRLLGDFAFAIWDSRERRLFCARDAFGCRPFVYFQAATQFVFASDVKGVLACVESPRLHEPLLAAHLQMNSCYAQKTLTFFEGVVKLPAGHTLTVAAGGVQTSQYWRPEDVPETRFGGEAEYAEQLGDLFRQAVECRVRSAFPIGAHLSGGLDSSAVTIAASGAWGELPVFSWSPAPGKDAPMEGEYARIGAVCRQEGLRCEFAPTTTADLLESFQLDFTVEPTVMMARENPVQVRAQERGLRVILSGWGGDEAVTCGAISRALRGGGGLRGLVSDLREMAVVRLPDSLYRLAVRDPYMKYESSCIQPAFARRYQGEMNDLRIPGLRRFPDVRSRICRLLEMGHVTLRAEQEAVSGARRGLVYRYPLLDRRLVEFALGSACSDQRRALFRQAMGGRLPASVEWKGAKAEAATLAALQREQIQAYSEWAQELAGRGDSPATNFVDPAKLAAAVQAGVKSRQMKDLSGVREAFGCYAISARIPAS